MTTTTTARKSSGQSYIDAGIFKGNENLPSPSTTQRCGQPTQEVTEGPRAELSGDGASSEQHQQGQPRLTIRQLREQAQNKLLEQHAKQLQQQKGSQPPNLARPVQQQQQQQQQKKSSLFGGLFQKEPSQVALDQVKAQLKAQHGSTSATKVPNVSLEQMPRHVPKVNSKWDGIPEGAKKREKERKKEQDKTSGPNSFPFFDSGYHSRDGKDRERRRGDSRNSSSTTGSFGRLGDRGSSSSRTNSTRARYYAPSVNSSGDLASQQRPEFSHPTHLSFESNSAGTPSEDGVPDSRSAVVHPPASPTVPLSLHQMLQSCTEDDREDADEGQLASSGPRVLGLPATSKGNRESIGPGFLAGEAQALVFPNKTDNDQQQPMTDSSLKNGKVSNRAASKSSSSSSRHLHPDAQDKAKPPARSSRHPSESSSRGTSSPRIKLSSSFGLFSKEKEHRTK